jgi:hypothetical protein
MLLAGCWHGGLRLQTVGEDGGPECFVHSGSTHHAQDARLPAAGGQCNHWLCTTKGSIYIKWLQEHAFTATNLCCFLKEFTDIDCAFSTLPAACVFICTAYILGYNSWLLSEQAPSERQAAAKASGASGMTDRVNP